MNRCPPLDRPYTRSGSASSTRRPPGAPAIIRLLCIIALAVLLAACREGEPSRARIEAIVAPDTVALTDATLAFYQADLAAALPGVTVRRVESDEAALQAVRSGDAGVALVLRSPALPLDGLEAVDVEVRPLAAFVPFTFPLEEISSQQLRELAAGRVQSWREIGGPSLPIETLSPDHSAAEQALGAPVKAAPVSDPAAALAESRGRVVLALGTSAGAMVKPLRIDGAQPFDTEYPIALRWAVAGRAGDARVAAIGHELAARAAVRSGPEVVLDAVGDIMLGREVGALIQTRGPRYPFEAVAPLLAGSDLRIGNLELPLTERGQRARKDYVFRAPPSAVEGLTWAGFGVVTLANNHMLDYGPEGLLDTLAALDRAGIAHPGAGRNAEEAHAPAIVTVQGLRLAILTYVNTPNDSISGWVAASMRAGPASPGVAWGTADAVRRDVAAASEKADLVIVAIHAGWEYTGPPNPVQRELAYAAIDAGAALVLGAHPHVLQGIELYKNVPVVYSLGNFIFDLDDDDRRHPGLPSTLTAVLRVRLGREGVRGLELRPAVIDQREGRPIPVSGAAARPVFERVYSLSDALASGR